MKRFSFIVLCMFSALALQGQDTMKVEPSIHYSSVEHPHQGKRFVSMLRYAREDIVFSDGSKQVDYCYYYDQKRHCHGSHYQLIGDSLLLINGKKAWNVAWLPLGGFWIWRDSIWYTEAGYAEGLIPFDPKGTITATEIETGAELWVADYRDYGPRNWLSSPHFYISSTLFSAKMYEEGEIDSLPRLENGEPLDTSFTWYQQYFRFGAPINGVWYVDFVIGTDSLIYNIVPFPPLDPSENQVDFIKRFKAMEPLIPAKRKGESVPVRLRMKVNPRS
ncbi:MAG: hypothetical protein AB8F95_21755 [Bacteroidia bacterium]